METAVESLSPTRVRLTVNVPFEELQPSVAAAYRKIGSQIRVQGFRPGKVPPPVIDRRVGRAAVLEEAVNEALPVFYGKAVEENSIAIIGHPEVEVTEFADGGALAFTAEVDVRPDFELPDYHGVAVTVDNADLTDEEVDEQLSSLRERFATLSGVDRPAQEHDFVTIDLRAEVDGTEVSDAAATGLSYEIGDDDLIAGLDTALIGLSEGESKTFATELSQGEYAGKKADVTVTVRGVRVKQVPDLDDDFAQTASEFDSIDELRADVRTRLERIRRLEQGMQARDRTIEALLGGTEVPLPENVVAEEVEWRQQSFGAQLQQAGLTKEQYFDFEQRTQDDVDKEIAQGAQQSVKAQFVLDAIADREQIQVTEAELGEQIVRRASRAGLAPDDYARRLVDSGGVAGLLGETRRAKALAHVLEQAVVTDASGRPVDLDALQDSAAGQPNEATTDNGDDS
ncbi:MAG: trigger factor [Actinomycetes bacterium]